jgi:hypothetical protein
MRKGEKALFYTLWALIILATGLWKFWPTGISGPSVPKPAVALRKDLHRLIASAEVTEVAAGHFLLTLNVSRAYQRLLKGEDKLIQVGYQLLRGRTLLYASAVAVRVESSEKEIMVTLPNPERVSPHIIQLYLAQ